MLLLVQSRRHSDDGRRFACRRLRHWQGRLAPHLDPAPAGSAASARSGITRWITRSTPRACAMRSTRACRAFPTSASTACSLRCATAPRRTSARCARSPSASPSSIWSRGATRFRTWRPAARGARRALRRSRDCGRLMRDADLASPEARARRCSAPRQRARRARSFDRRSARSASEESMQRERVRYAPPAAAPAARRRRRPACRASSIRSATWRSPRSEIARLAAGLCAELRDRDRAATTTVSAGCVGAAREALPQVDAAEPAVYVHAAYTLYGEHVLLQLVYTIWFAERPARDTFDPGAGPLDGVVWRVTLAPDGEPLVYDCDPCLRLLPCFLPDRARPATPGATRRYRGGLGAAAPAARRRGPAPGGEARQLDARHRGRAPRACAGKPGALRAASLRRTALHAAPGGRPPQRLRSGRPDRRTSPGAAQRGRQPTGRPGGGISTTRICSSAVSSSHL